MSNARKIGVAVARRLQEHGFTAVFAGGCVRDRFLGVEPKDFDVATNATPAQIKTIFADETVLLVGETFGVIVIVRDGEQIEVATFRGDGQYGDGRRPDSVVFLNDVDPLVALKEDAARRDLTINAMFEDPITGEIFDFFGGQTDLKNRIIRAVGDAGQRFTEDRLRMLRVVRFAAKLGFKVDETLMSALKQYASDLKPGVVVAFERIAKEMEGILLAKNPVVGLELLMETGLMKEFLPEMLDMVGEDAIGDPIWHPEGTAFVHTCLVLTELAKEEEKSFELMFGGLLHDIAKPRTVTRRVETRDGVEVTRISNHGHAEVGAEMAKVICRRFKLSADQTHRVSETVRLHMQMHDFNSPDIRRSKLVRLMQRDDIMDLIRMQHADSLGTGRLLEERVADSNRSFFLNLLEEMKNDPTPSKRTGANALVEGSMIIKRGFKPGPIFRVIKDAAFEAQHSGEFTDVDGAEKWLDDNAETFRKMTPAEIAAAQETDGVALPKVTAGGKSCC